ncbi:MAG: hypothetical protein ACI865_001972 [Flavobacteriaceae bacterium]|jgi:hypothetical protein
MKLLVFFLLASSFSFGQWESIPLGVTSSIQTAATNQFEIDPYRNSFWFVMDHRASVIEDDGTIYSFGETELGTLGSFSELYFAFTPNHIYYSTIGYGLNNFDNYVSSSVFVGTDISRLHSDQDTVFMIKLSNSLFTYHPNEGTNLQYTTCNDDLISKNGIKYHGHSLAYLEYPNIYTFLSLTDPDYLLSPGNTMTFSRYTDTMYYGQETGVSIVYLDDVFDTITPNNTVGMPSSNVLDIEFDMNDSLWAVFGDASGDPFALAMLEGNTWTNIYDSSNSPISFQGFYGLEFDTLNNLWVADWLNLHTLTNPNTPDWLGLSENAILESGFQLYPNPSKSEIHLVLKEGSFAETIRIYDGTGRVVTEVAFESVLQLNINSGSYIVEILNNYKVVGRQRLNISL